MTKTVHSSLEEHFGNQAALWGSVGAEVNGGKWHLCASAAVHSIEVMHEAFHGLQSLMFGIFVGFFDNFFGNFGFLELFVVTQSNVIFDGDIELFASEVLVFFEVFFEGFAESLVDRWRKAVVEIRNRLTTVLLVLVGLEDNGSESGGSTNGLRSAEEAVASIKTFVEHLEYISLAASECAGS